MSKATTMATLAALLVFGMAAQAQAQAQQERTAPSAAGVGAPVPAATATTVFVDANFGGRKNGAAKALSKKHAEMEAQGWRFAHLAPYTENGDLVGFFVTYVR